MKKHKSRIVVSVFIAMMLAATLVAPVPALAAELPVNLGSTVNFAVLAGSTITNTGQTTISGEFGADVGLYPGTSITQDAGPITLLDDGVFHTTDEVAQIAKDDLDTAYNDAAGRTPVRIATELGGGLTLKPGVYDSASGTFEITGALTLDAEGDPDGVFIFQMATTLVTASASKVVLTNGARFCRVFWQVGSSATLGEASDFVGHIFADQSITAGTGATIQGQLLARTAAVTLHANTITNGFCGPTGTKTWVDNSDVAGLRPNALTLTLTQTVGAVSTVVAATPTWVKTGGDTWTYTYPNLPLYKGGVPVTYSVTETGPTGYTKTSSDLAAENRNFTNTLSTTVTGTKTWVDNGNTYLTRPTDLVLTLTKTVNGTSSTVAATPTWDKVGNTWTYTYANLPLYEGGYLVTYSVTETGPIGYTKTSTDLPQNRGFTNALSALTTVTGTKTWVDNGNTYLTRPADLVLTLTKTVNGTSSTVAATPTWDKVGNTWTYTYANLPLYEGGVLVTYSVTETAPTGYTKTSTDLATQNRDFTNEQNTNALTTVIGTKTWVDNGNTYLTRPTDLVLTLTKTVNGTSSTVAATPTWVKVGNTWTYTYANLPLYEGGVLVTYSVTETVPIGYTKTSTDLATQNRNFTNEMNTNVLTTVIGTKTWVDNGNTYLTRPTDLVLTLIKTVNGTSSPVAATPTWVKVGNTWTYTYANLPLYEGGVLVTYSVAETAPIGYTKTSTDLATQNRNFTNALSVPTTPTPVPSPTNLPPTGDKTADRSTLGILAAGTGIVLVLAGISLYLFKRRKAKS